MDVMNTMIILGGIKKRQVFIYMLEHLDSTGKINTTIRELALNAGVSVKTANDAIQILLREGVFKRKGGVYKLKEQL